jgi:hypothetical protein
MDRCYDSTISVFLNVWLPKHIILNTGEEDRNSRLKTNQSPSSFISHILQPHPRAASNKHRFLPLRYWIKSGQVRSSQGLFIMFGMLPDGMGSQRLNSPLLIFLDCVSRFSITRKETSSKKLSFRCADRWSEIAKINHRVQRRLKSDSRIASQICHQQLFMSMT